MAEIAASLNALPQPLIDSSTTSPSIEDLPSSSVDEVVQLLAQELIQDVQEALALTHLMVEAQGMCEHVVRRIGTIVSESSKMSLLPPADVLISFKALLTKYVEFLKKFASHRVIYRLVRNRVVVQQNLKFHTDIDNLLNGLRLPEASEALQEWRQKWEGFNTRQTAAFRSMSVVKNKLVENLSDPSDAHAQTEALGFLLYEYNKVTDEYTPEELEVLNTAFSALSKFSRSKAPTVAMWFLPPYQFEREHTPFAFGCFGNVYNGTYGGSEVVVKCMKIEDATKAKTQSSLIVAFVKEANLWFKASQIPNVVHLYAANHLDETPYFVCEKAANGTLKNYLSDPKNRRQIWNLLLDAANGIRALHQLRILHNDLKCDNIVVSADGKAKITDFGLSCELPRPDSNDQIPVLKDVGAIPWKARELLLGDDASPPSVASDVYAFGMCIIEAVSNNYPWGGMMEVTIKRKVKSGKLPPRPDDIFEDDEWDLVVRICAHSIQLLACPWIKLLRSSRS
ncbi:Tkl protein kinase [Globisporangium polare]